MAKVVKGERAIELKTEHSYAPWFKIESTSSTAATLTRSPNLFDAPTSGVLQKTGTSSSYVALGTTADTNALQYYLASTATTGTTRGLYLRLKLSSGAGGEAVRAFTTVESNTPADTVNGAHISLSFGSSAGNVTGLGSAVRATLHVPNRALTGTTAAIIAELWADGSSSDVTGTCSLIRARVDGDGTGKGVIDAKSYFLDLTATAGTYNSDEMICATNDATASGAIKVLINGAKRWLLYTATLNS